MVFEDDSDEESHNEFDFGVDRGYFSSNSRGSSEDERLLTASTVANPL